MVTGDDFDEQVIHSFQVEWDKGTLTNLGGVAGPSRRGPGTTGYFYYPPKFIANDNISLHGNGYEPGGLWVELQHKQRFIGRRPHPPRLRRSRPVGYAAIPGTVAAADPANHLVLTYIFHEGDSSGTQWGP